MISSTGSHFLVKASLFLSSALYFSNPPKRSRQKALPTDILPKNLELLKPPIFVQNRKFWQTISPNPNSETPSFSSLFISIFFIWAAVPASVPTLLFVVPPHKRSSTQAGLQV